MESGKPQRTVVNVQVRNYSVWIRETVKKEARHRPKAYFVDAVK